MKKNIFKVDGRFYYGWIILVVAFMPAFISLTIKGNCAPLFMESLQNELGISRTVYTQTNTVMTVAMMITSFFIGSILQGWMIIAGNLGQIVGPTVAAAVYDTTGSYGAAWIIFAALMVCVCVLYFLSTRASTKQIADLGYVAVD